MLHLKAKDIMNPNVITVSEDMTISEAANLFAEKMISGAPVLDRKNKLVGVISVSDIARASSCGQAAITTKEKSEFYDLSWEDQLSAEDLDGIQLEIDIGIKVREVMTPIILCVQEETSIADMADIMISGRIHRLLVSKEGKILGIITTMDMLKIIRDWARQIDPPVADPGLK